MKSFLAIFIIVAIAGVNAGGPNADWARAPHDTPARKGENGRLEMAGTGAATCAGNGDGGTLTADGAEGTSCPGVAVADGGAADAPSGGGGVRGGAAPPVGAAPGAGVFQFQGRPDRRAGFQGALAAVELHIGTHSQRNGRPLKRRAQ